MDLKIIEDKARSSALQQIETMFKKPSDLARTDEYIERNRKAKDTADYNLKILLRSNASALEGELDVISKISSNVSDIKTAFVKIKNNLDVAKNIELGDVRLAVLDFSEKIQCNEVFTQLSQLKLKLDDISRCIDNDNLLEAHCHLRKIEEYRDCCYFELHQLPSIFVNEKMLIWNYFDGVKCVSDKLLKRLKSILSETLQIVQKNICG